MRLKVFIFIVRFLFTVKLSSQLIYPAQNFSLIGHVDPETGFNQDGNKYSSCWGWYQESKNKEYAIACSQSGIYWIDITNPFTPTVSAYQTSAHQGAIWRETKTYSHYCYVIGDDAGINTFQIFDMQYLPDSVIKVKDDDSLFSRGHTLCIDGDKLYVASVTYSNSGLSSMNVYGLGDPKKPVLLRRLKQDYPFINRVHDMHVRNDTVYASCEFQGLYVFRLTPSDTFNQLGSLSSYTASGFNHSSALTPNGRTLVFTDELPNNLPLKIADVSNLSNIQVLSTINQYSLTTPHNPYIVSNQLCFMSSYEDGLQLFDISSPSTPTLIGYFDTYPQAGGNTGTWSNPYNGLWGAYPFFPSKNIFALDQLNGVFILRSEAYGGAITGLEEATEYNGFNCVLFPNPAKDRIHFNVPYSTQTLRVLILDATGVRLLTYEENELNPEGSFYRSIKLPPLSEGIYFLQVYSQENLVTTKKFIISN